jgi:hypothetical protein
MRIAAAKLKEMPPGVGATEGTVDRGCANVLVVLGELPTEAAWVDCDADDGAEMVRPRAGSAADFGDVPVATVVEGAGGTVEATMVFGSFPSAIAAIFRASRGFAGLFMKATSQFWLDEEEDGVPLPLEEVV